MAGLDISWSKSRPQLNHSMRWYGRVLSEAERQYLEKARSMLFKLYKEEGVREPQLIAVIGFLELSAGHFGEAMRYLEEATAAGVPRPTVYVDLARLRLDLALSAPSGAEGQRPSREQIEPVCGLLREALRRCPEMRSAYTALAKAWGSSGETPTKEDLEMLVCSVRWFPEQVAVTCEIALLCEQGGDNEEAATLARIGLAWLSDRASGKLEADLCRLAGLSEAKP